MLAHVNGLHVASRTASFQFRKSELGAPAVAQKLGVRHILEGSVRKAGTTVRIAAQLIDGRTNQHLWSQTFDRPLTTANLFAIQDEVARTIVDHHLSVAYAARGAVQGNLVLHDATISRDDSISSLTQAIAYYTQDATAIAWRGISLLSLGYLDRAAADLRNCLDSILLMRCVDVTSH